MGKPFQVLPVSIAGAPYPSVTAALIPRFVPHQIEQGTNYELRAVDQGSAQDGAGFVQQAPKWRRYSRPIALNSTAQTADNSSGGICLATSPLAPPYEGISAESNPTMTEKKPAK